MAAAPAVTFDSLRKSIRKGDLAPVYILHGEEGYFIDQLVKEFENVLSPEDKEFNQYILYAPQSDGAQIIEACSRIPMMANRQMVIVKEAQNGRADQLNKLAPYLLRPNPTTVLVIVFRGDKAKGKDLLAAAKKGAVVFESKKVREYALLPLIQNCAKEHGLNIDQKSQEMLRDYIGADVSRIHNEIGKLAVILGPGSTITPASIERNIGISKDYNTFELIDALAVKNVSKVMRITSYFKSNPKANPTVMITSALYNFYSSLMVAFYAKDKSDSGLMKELGLNYQTHLRKFKEGMRHYNAFQVIEAIWAIRQFDTRSKGNGSRQSDYELFGELMYHLLTAPGQLFRK